MAAEAALCDAIVRFFRDSERPVLFAGAGISVKAGLPTWDRYISALAEQIRPNDPFTRHHMLECVNKKKYALAAEYFFLSSGLTDGDKYRAITDPLKNYDIRSLLALGAMPFASYVTTNYDRSLFDLYANCTAQAAQEVNLGDPTLSAAPFQEGFYIARIHGRVEVPEQMVLSQSHYAKLMENDAYVDFLRQLFCFRSLMIIGFSFLDPAIQLVLRTIRDRVGAIHAGRHLAFVEHDADAEFIEELNRHNIQVVRYDSSANHKRLWEALERCGGKDANRLQPRTTPKSDVFSYVRQYLATALTRKKMSEHMLPLKQAVAEGMVLELLQQSGVRGIEQGEIAKRLGEQLGIDAEAANRLVDGSLKGLATDSLYVASGDGRIKASAARDHTEFESAIGVLIDGAINRLIVREGGKDEAETRKTLKRYFEYLVLRRGWDIGAAYAARRPPQDVVVAELLGQCLAEEGIRTALPKSLVRAVENVLVAPSDPEAAVLAELGRLAFALELVRQAPQDTLFSTHVLPSRIYLDANVLMPAIVEGHPYNRLYSDAMERLLAASRSSVSGLEVCAYFGFLNEVVSHRRLAQQEIEGRGSAAIEHIERLVRLDGGTNINVFVAGFARTLISGSQLSFGEYLSRFAPYSTETELAAWLRGRGIRVIQQREMSTTAFEYPRWLHHFEVMFANDIANRRRTAVLVAHDALQIAKLHGDIRRGERAVLVTADKRMRDAVAYSEYQHVGTAMLSGAGIVQMIELLVGAVGSERAIAQLLWSTRASNEAEKIRRYLVDLALNKYDAALTMSMESTVREITEDIMFAMASDAEKKGGDIEESMRLGKYIENFEPRFYEMMRAEQERLQKER